MAVPRNFKNGPLSPMGRATGPLSPRQGATSLFCKKIFANRSSVSAARGSAAGGGALAAQRATGGACRPPPRATRPRSARRGGSTAARGARSPPLQATGSPPLYKPPTPIPSSFEPRNSTKNPEKKKRGVRRREAAKPCRITHL